MIRLSILIVILVLVGWSIYRILPAAGDMPVDTTDSSNDEQSFQGLSKNPGKPATTKPAKLLATNADLLDQQAELAKDNLQWLTRVQESLDQFVTEGVLNLNLEKQVVERPSMALDLLADYYTHDNVEVRWFAASLSVIAGLSSTNIEDRQRVTESLVEFLEDDKELVWQYVAKELLRFNEQDFSSNTRLNLKQLLHEKPNREIIKIVAVAGLVDEIDHLGQLLDDARATRDKGQPVRYGSVDWAARLARARLGNSEDLLVVVSEVEAEQNEVLRVGSLLRDLAYTRTIDSVEVLKNYLGSNDRLPKTNEYIQGALHNQYALAALATMFEDFPVPVKSPGQYTYTDIIKSQAWLVFSINWESKLIK